MQCHPYEDRGSRMSGDGRMGQRQRSDLCQVSVPRGTRTPFWVPATGAGDTQARRGLLAAADRPQPSDAPRPSPKTGKMLVKLRPGCRPQRRRKCPPLSLGCPQHGGVVVPH